MSSTHLLNDFLLLNPTSPSVPGPLWAYFKCQTNRKRVLRADDTRSVSTVSASSDGTALQQSHLVVVQSHVELGHSVVHIHSLLVMGWRSLHPLPCTYFPSTLVSCSLCSRIILQLSSFMTCCDFSISSFEVLTATTDLLDQTTILSCVKSVLQSVQLEEVQG